MMTDKPEAYALTEAEHERIFRQDIVPEYFPETLGSSSNPTAVILGGQPGSGKAALLEPAERDLRAIGPTVVINGDDLRSFHPAYETFQRTDPHNAARFTDRDSGKWVEKLIDEGIARRVNLVIESTMRNPDVFSMTSDKLRSGGYTVQARAIAVNERDSWQGVHTRYEGMIEKGTLPRFTVRQAHDAGAEGMLKTLQRIEVEQLADRVLIGARGGGVIYDNRLENGVWKEPPAAAQAVLAERARIRTPQEIERFSNRWQDVVARMEKRGADLEKIETVRQTARRDVEFFQHQAQVLQGDATRPALAVAFERLSEADALAAHPDLETAYKTLHAAEAHFSKEFAGNGAAFEKVIAGVRQHIQGRLDQGETRSFRLESSKDRDTPAAPRDSYER